MASPFIAGKFDARWRTAHGRSGLGVRVGTVTVWVAIAGVEGGEVELMIDQMIECVFETAVQKLFR